MTRNGRITLAAVVAAVALLAIGGAVVATRGGDDRFAACRQGVAAGGLEAFGGPFTLTDQDGRRVTDREVFTKPSLLYFGYTFCPDVCPADNSRNALAIDDLKARGIDAQAVFVSVDPARDTPAVVKDFVQAMHPQMIGLTGTEAEITAVNKLWRNYYKAQHKPGEDPRYYLVDHMTNTYLVLPDAGTVDFFGRDVTPESMADRTACFIKADH